LHFFHLLYYFPYLNFFPTNRSPSNSVLKLISAIWVHSNLKYCLTSVHHFLQSFLLLYSISFVSMEAFFFFEVLGYLLGRYYTTWATPPALFYVGFFWDRVSHTICLRLVATQDPPE
jgi:hypothetical protein